VRITTTTSLSTDEDMVRSESETRTDRHGRFRIGLTESPPSASNRKMTVACRTRGFGIPLFAEADLPLVLPAGELEIEFRLEAPPRVAAGIVVDQDGRPIRGARLTLFEAVKVEANGDTVWKKVTQADTTSSVDGRFVLHTETRADRLSVAVHHDRFNAPGRREFSRGAEQLELVMSATGRLAGRVLLQTSVGRPRLVFVLRDTVGGEVQRATASLKSDGSFDTAPMSPGTFDLSVLLDGEDDSLAEIPGVEVPAGRTNHDPRLAEIDLRSRLRSLVIEVASESGEPIDGFGLAVRRSTLPDASWKTQLRPGSSTQVLYSGTGVDLQVSAPGHRPQRFEGVDTDRRIQLRAGLPLRFTLAQGLPRLKPDQSLLLVIQHEGGERPWRVGGRVQAAFEDSGSVRMQAPDSGEYKLMMQLRGSNGRAAAVSFPGRTLVVREVRDEQRFEFEVAHDSIRAAQAELEAP
jgi:hypothetical protein